MKTSSMKWLAFGVFSLILFTVFHASEAMYYRTPGGFWGIIGDSFSSRPENQGMLELSQTPPEGQAVASNGNNIPSNAQVVPGYNPSTAPQTQPVYTNCRPNTRWDQNGNPIVP